MKGIGGQPQGFNLDIGGRMILVSPNRELTESILKAAGGRLTDTNCLIDYPSSQSILGRDYAVCLLDVGTNQETALKLSQELTEAGLPVIALHISNDADLILRSLRCGACEFLSLPIAKEQVSAALDRISRKHNVAPDKDRPGRVIMVMPAKSNYGSTTISSNLAVRLKKVERRKVLLVDMDTLTGSLSFLLKLKSPFSVVDAAADWGGFDPALWPKLVVSHGDVDVLLGPEAPQFDHFPEQDVPSLFQFWRDRYGCVILDSPGPTSAWQLALAKHADLLLLVTTNELAAVHAVQRTVRHMESCDIEQSRVHLVLNRYEKHNGLSLEAIQNALRLNVYQTLPNDYESVQKAVLDGRTVNPASKFGKAIDELAERVSGVNRQQNTRRSPGLFKIFSRKQSRAA